VKKSKKRPQNNATKYRKNETKVTGEKRNPRDHIKNNLLNHLFKDENEPDTQTNHRENTAGITI